MGNWYIQVTNTGGRSRRVAHQERGGEVSVRVDADLYAQGRLRKAVAMAVARGVELSEQAQAELVEAYKWEAENGIIRR